MKEGDLDQSAVKATLEKNKLAFKSAEKVVRQRAQRTLTFKMDKPPS